MHGIEIDVLTAFRRKNRSLLQQYINREIRLYYDVYIAVDESFRASVICCPSSVDEELANRNNPYQLHNQTKVLHRRDFAMDFCKRFCRILLQFCTDDVELCNQVHRQIERLPSRAIAITKPTSICGVNIDDYIFCLISIISAFVAILLYYGQR